MLIPREELAKLLGKFIKVNTIGPFYKVQGPNTAMTKLIRERMHCSTIAARFNLLIKIHEKKTNECCGN